MMTDDDIEALSDDERVAIDFNENEDSHEGDIDSKELKDFITKLKFNAVSPEFKKDKKKKKLKEKFQSDETIQHNEISSTTHEKQDTKSQKLNTSIQKHKLFTKQKTVKNKKGVIQLDTTISKNLHTDSHTKVNKKEQKTFSQKNTKKTEDVGGVIPLMQFKSRTTLLIKPGTNIFSNEISREDTGKPPVNLVKQLEDLAFKISTNEISIYSQRRERHRKSERGWLKKVVSSGTLSDKIAALTLQVQESPVHNVGSLDILINMSKKKGRRENSQAIEALQELFLVHILPDARHLIAFDQRPLERLGDISSGNKDAFDRLLLTWYTESLIKSKYSDLVKAIEVLTFDTVPASKKSAISSIYKMLSSKPEQEQLLLSILVNKLGDKEVKIASKCAYLLTKLVSYHNHPNMKEDVIKDVENILYRPNISPRAQYYAVCFLSQVLLSRSEVKLANKLIAIYLSFFKMYIQKGDVDRKMMSSLLSGVNRAYPFSKVDQSQVLALVNDLYRLVHTINFNTSVQALMLLFQLNNAMDDSSDRFYTAIYKKITDPGLRHSNKHSLILNLLYKTMTTDPCHERVKAFVKRLLQACHHQLPPFICATLFLVSEVLQRNTRLSLNATGSIQPTSAPVADDSDDDGLEHFTDVPNPDSDSDDPGKKYVDDDKPGQLSSWHHQFVTHQGDKDSGKIQYDPFHRNPRYCHSNIECVWELTALAKHYHPSVSLFASTILKGEAMSYDGDPLKDFTIIRFLDRFAFKNPKRVTSDSGSGATLRRRDYKPRGLRALPLSSTAYLQTSAIHIPPEERFLYNYLKRVGPKHTKQVDSDEESIGDDEFDEYLETIHMKEKEKLDFAGDMVEGKGKKRSKHDEDESSSEDAGSDDEVEFDEAEVRDMMGDEGVDSDDEENVQFSESDDELAELASNKKSKRKASLIESGDRVNKKARSSASMADLFATADEFASLLDNNATTSTDAIGESAVSNKDKASAKQLAWEKKQQKWLQEETIREKKRKVKKAGVRKKYTKDSANVKSTRHRQNKKKRD